MLKPADDWFLKQEEPARACLQFLRSSIINMDEHITEAWKYGMPFFCYKGKMFCYLWVHKKYKQPYFGIVEGNRVNHPDLLSEKRARMKILLLDPAKAIPVKKINSIFRRVLKLYK